jgi:hydrogenase expression/formation protein HypC
MCLGSIDVLVEVWEDADARTGRLGCGKVVSLAFVPEAREGDYVLVHLGIPVEVLDPSVAEDALALRVQGQGGSA